METLDSTAGLNYISKQTKHTVPAYLTITINPVKNRHQLEKLKCFASESKIISSLSVRNAREHPSRSTDSVVFTRRTPQAVRWDWTQEWAQSWF